MNSCALWVRPYPKTREPGLTFSEGDFLAMYDDLKGKAALVTGAGKKTGIGFAIAEKMPHAGRM